MDRDYKVEDAADVIIQIEMDPDLSERVQKLLWQRRTALIALFERVAAKDDIDEFEIDEDEENACNVCADKDTDICDECLTLTADEED